MSDLLPLDDDQNRRVAALCVASSALDGGEWTVADLVEAARYIVTGESTPVDDRFIQPQQGSRCDGTDDAARIPVLSTEAWEKVQRTAVTPSEVHIHTSACPQCSANPWRAHASDCPTVLGDNSCGCRR